MSAWLVSAGLVVVLLGQADRENPAAGTAEVIDKAIQDLGDARFAVRNRASRDLWEQGLAAQAALERAAESADRETRERARAILKDFRYGILPGVPDGTVALIRQFRDGNGAERPAAFQRLADRGEFETLTRLIGLEPDASLRRQLLVLLVQNPRAVDKLVDLDHLEKLLAAVAADQDEAWRRTVLAQMLFSEKMLQRLAEKRQLDLVVKVIDRETSAETRRQMLSVLFQNSAAVTSLVEKEQLDLLLKLIQKEPEKRIRGPWIQQILANPETVARLAGDERLAAC